MTISADAASEELRPGIKPLPVVLNKRYPDRRIVWRVKHGKRETQVYLGGPLPAWVHEYADTCRWKLIKGAELL